MAVAESIVHGLRAIVGAEWIRTDPPALETYGQDALWQGHPPDLVVLPADTAQIAAIARLCDVHRLPLVVRGAGTGYTGGAVPTFGGVLLSMERLNRILEIDQTNLLAVVEPNVVTGQIQREVERVGLFYPPDPASLDRSAIGGNVAECAGGPRAFKYGTTRRYVLGLEAVLPTGDVIRTGSKTVKNVVGYDLTQLLVGSEGTLAIITEIILRLILKPRARATLRATFRDIAGAIDGVLRILRSGVTPSAIELIDAASLEAVRAYVGKALAPDGTGAVLLLEVDGGEAAVAEDASLVERALAAAGATEIRRATDESEREELWRLRRELSPSLKTIARLKLNHDVVVPTGRIPELFDLVDGLRRRFALRIASFGHAGDGNIHVNIMAEPDDRAEVALAHEADRLVFER